MTDHVRTLSFGSATVSVINLGDLNFSLGDLYHHEVEVEQPTWMVKWANPDANLASRQTLAEAALAENALLIPAHMPVGRLERTSSGVRWVTV